MGKGKGLGAHRVKPRTEVARICTDGEAIGRVRALDEELARVERADREQNRTPQAPQIARQIREAEEAAEASMVAITLQGIGDPAWRRLLAAHPPTRKQLTEAKDAGLKKPDHDPDVFPYEAIAASITSIDGEPAEESADTVREFFDSLPQGEFARIWGLTLLVNVGDNSVPFSRAASRHLEGYEENSTSAEPTESPTPTS
jgi:hypothetical protein